VEINETPATQTPAAEPKTVAEQAGLGRDAFLKIFLAQLEYQDPLDPQDSSELAAQLAQYSQLEQSLQMTDQLRGINSRLDTLIEASGSNGNLVLDPIAMLGRQVGIAGNSIRLPDAGASEELRIDLERESKYFGLVAQDPLGQFIGLAIADSEENPLTLAPGTYELTFVDEQPKLKASNGQELPLELSALLENQDGRFEIDPEAGPVSFRQGTVYQFTVVAIDREGRLFEPRTTTTGTVDGVRIVDGQPVLSIAGQDIDPSQIIRIR
jgi:hypothetical protein